MKRAPRQRMVGLALLAGALCLPPPTVGAQAAEPRLGALHASLGAGFVGLDQGLGMDLPAGVTLLLARRRLVASLNLLDLALLEGSDKDPRYRRAFYGAGQPPACVDTETGYLVSAFRCSGGTNAIGSFSADIAYVAVEELWLAGRPGRLYTGLGYRGLNPSTPYWTAGMLFKSTSRMAGGFKGAVGRDYVYLGLLWSYRLI